MMQRLAQKIIPFSAIDSDKPEDLMEFFGKNTTLLLEEKRYPFLITVMISGGRMFPLENSYGEPVDTAYSNMRNRWEPLS